MPPLTCPNCSQSVDTTPIHCPRCGYRSDLAREYFWIYLSGVALIVLGFGFGLMSLLVHEAPLDHWSGPLREWFPFCSWTQEYHWIGFLIAGIAWTLGGMGVTRHRWDGWLLVLGTVLWELVRGALELSGGVTLTLVMMLVVGSALLLTLLRVGLALRRTPPRNIYELQKKGDRESAGSDP